MLKMSLQKSFDAAKRERAVVWVQNCAPIFRQVPLLRLGITRRQERRDARHR